MDFAFLSDHRVIFKESEKNDKYLEIARLKRKLWNMKVPVISLVIGVLGTTTKIGKRTRELGNKRRSGDNPNQSIGDIGQNTEKSPGDLRGLVVT